MDTPQCSNALLNENLAVFHLMKNLADLADLALLAD